MDRLQRAALLTQLVKSLRGHGSWAGETHVQKAAYLLQNLLDVPFGFSFVLYRHGPFSFDLRDELTAMRADEMLELELQPPPYGPKFKTTRQADLIQDLYPKTLKQYKAQLDFIADKLGQSGVSDLEKLATAYYVKTKLTDSTLPEWVNELHEIKPHISEEDAKVAFETIQTLEEDARQLN